MFCRSKLLEALEAQEELSLQSRATGSPRNHNSSRRAEGQHLGDAKRVQIGSAPLSCQNLNDSWFAGASGVPELTTATPDDLLGIVKLLLECIPS